MTTMIETRTTCGPACWGAVEQDCHCSCAGTAHGIMRQGGGDGLPPRRNCLINGTRYVIADVSGSPTGGGRFHTWARTWAREHGTVEERPGHALRHLRVDPVWNAPNAIMQARLASSEQAEKWPEVTRWLDALRERLTTYSHGRAVRVSRPYLLWVREDAAADFDAWQAAGEPRN